MKIQELKRCEMIRLMYKTEMKEMPKNCYDCWVLCDLPYEDADCEPIFDKEYLDKRHKDCPLVEIKGEIELLDSLHEKILKSSFAEKVTEREIDALVEAKKMYQ